ncbi:MAG: ABC transporter permease [Rhodobacterales bacterium]|nr:MAG: ABC transporter permease [Rhodobacterales bacterium]
MDFGQINPVLLAASLMVASTPILLAALGEMVVEKAGVLNLGVEGMMITGAVVGFAVGVNTASPGAGFVAAALAGAGLSLVFALITQVLKSNQVATGLALTLFGLGLSSLIGKPYEGMKSATLGKLPLPGLADLPVVGPVLFQHDPMVYLSLLAVVLCWLFLGYSRAGLILRAVGENHEAAHALGYKVVRVRVLAILFGGAMAGLGGAYVSLVRVPQWTEGMTSGAGWIALAIVVFASWRTGWVLFGAYLFGGLTVLQLNLQAAGIALLAALPWLLGALVPVSLLVALAKQLPGRRFSLRKAGRWPLIFGAAAGAAWLLGLLTGFATGADTLLLTSSPYLVTILVLVVISMRGNHGAPGSLGRVFHASH